MSIRKNKEKVPLTPNLGIFSTRSNLHQAYNRPHTAVIPVEVQQPVELGGSDEDPLPTIRPIGLACPINRKYSRIFFRSATSRPLMLDSMLYPTYATTDPSHEQKTEGPSRLKLRLGRVFGLVKRYLLIKIRDMHRIANLLYFPTIDILIGGLIWLWQEQGNPDLDHVVTQYLLALIFWIVTNAAQFETCFNFLEEFQSRNLINLFASTLEEVDWLISSAILCIFEALLSTTICSIIAYKSFGVSLTILGWQLPFVALLFVCFGWILAIFTAGLFLIWGQRLTFLIWAVPYIVLPLSAPFYAVEALPKWAQCIAYCLPTTYLFEAVREIALGKAMPFAYLGISFILTLIYGLAVIFFFKAMFKMSKQKGLARLEQD